jgi:hypothetical protein
VDLHLKDLAVASDGCENQLGVNLASRVDLHKLVLIGHSQDGKGEKLGQSAAGAGLVCHYPVLWPSGAIR